MLQNSGAVQHTIFIGAWVLWLQIEQAPANPRVTFQLLFAYTVHRISFQKHAFSLLLMTLISLSRMTQNENSFANIRFFFLSFSPPLLVWSISRCFLVVSHTLGRKNGHISFWVAHYGMLLRRLCEQSNPRYRFNYGTDKRCNV